MNLFVIASLQLELSGSNNLGKIIDEIRKVKTRFPVVRMVVLGELAVFGAKIENNISHGEVALSKLGGLADELNIWLIPGSIYQQQNKQNYNVAPVFDPDGNIVTQHEKLYPFLPHEQNVSPGSQFTIFDIPDIGRFGLCICYDMWYPEVIRTLACMGAEVIIHPTMTNTVDREVEICIARANAAINQCYFVDVNVAGDYGVGLSVICGPGGECIHQAGSGREVITTTIDLDSVRQVREEGWHALGQPLKSFRDTNIEFPIYQPHGKEISYLKKLGKLKKPD